MPTAQQGVRALRGMQKGLTPDAQYMGKVGLPHIVDRLLRHVLSSQPPSPRGVVRKIKEACDDELRGETEEVAVDKEPDTGATVQFMCGEMSKAGFLDALESMTPEERRKQVGALCDTARAKGKKGFPDEARELDGASLFDHIIRETQKQIPNATRAVFHLRDADNDVLYDPADPAVRALVGKGVIGRVAEGKHGTLSVAFGPSNEPTDEDKALVGTSSRVVSAPLMSASLGVMATLSVLGDEKEFTAEEVEHLTFLAKQAGPMVFSSITASTLQSTRNQVDVLLDVARRLASELEVNSLIRTIMQVSRDLLSADRATLFLVDKEHDQLYSSVADGTGEIRIPRSAGIAGAVATTASPINIPSAYADSRFTSGRGPTIDRDTGYKTNSILCMPMTDRQGEVIGVTQMINKTSGSAFGKDDTRLLSAFSSQAAVAIENSLLFKRTEESKNLFMSVLASIKNLIVTLDEKGRVLTINRDPVEFGIGIGKDKMLSTPYTEWFDRRPQESDQPVERKLSTGEGEHRTMGQRRRSSTRPGRPVCDAYYNGLLFEDINECYKTGKDRQVSEFTYVKVADGEETTLTLNYRIMALRNFDEKQVGVIMVLEDISSEAQMMATLGKYMSPELAAAALEGGTQLGGQQLPVSVLFVDIRNFTGLSEALEAPQVVETLNEYFKLMGGSVLDHGGIVDKYIGDAVMAVFGVPFPAEDDAERVCRCALEMFELLDNWNANRKKEGLDEVRMGIGVNSGDVVAGNIGFEKRMEYTVIGDGVNLSSRMEGATKEYKTKILITEFTQESVVGKFHCREVDCIRVVGKKKPVKIFDLQGEVAVAPLPEKKQKSNELYAEGLEAYRARDWQKALDKWQAAVDLGDQTSIPMVQRAKFFINDPIIAPKEGWDGVFDMINK
eukprot:TRINITY_DN1415_c1_g1_i4.p1 TRINITY_DN1415_c1_g1~~TRINITY_DN1415_c1_g1_i4.p1  ORF type:complete len:901 (+),score=315.08 TRINITY_DN1415_c1_g1_i4:167-2869(+)